jgi:uncharacterized OB-fold protein
MMPSHWRLQKQKYSLVGSRCVKCSALFFPGRRLCMACSSQTEDFKFKGAGTVESYTTVHVAPAGFKGPYDVGIVKLDEGPNVVAQLVGDGAAIGKRVAVVFRRLEQEEGEAIRYGFKFEIA